MDTPLHLMHQRCPLFLSNTMEDLNAYKFQTKLSYKFGANGSPITGKKKKKKKDSMKLEMEAFIFYVLILKKRIERSSS